MQQQITAKNAEITAKQAQLTTAQGELAALQASKTTLEAEIAALTTRSMRFSGNHRRQNETSSRAAEAKNRPSWSR